MAGFLERLFGTTWNSRKDAATREQRGRTLRRVMQLETLEKREVFATLIDAMNLTFQDKDGDQVQAHFSKPILSQSNVELRIQIRRPKCEWLQRRQATT